LKDEIPKYITQLKYFKKVIISCCLSALTLSACSSPQATSLSNSTPEKQQTNESTPSTMLEPDLTLYPVEVDGKWGYINATGEMVIPPQFHQALDFSEGLALISLKLEGKWGYIDTTGNIVIPPQFDDAFYFSEGMAKVVIDKKVGYINKTGDLVIPPQFEPIYSRSFSEGLAVVQLESGMGYINKAGQMVIPATIPIAHDFKEGLALVNGVDGFWGQHGFINKQGKPAFRRSREILSITRRPFSEGLVPISTERGRGYMDRKGQIAIEGQFYNALNFSEGLAQVETGFVPATIAERNADIKGKWGYIDKTGRIVIEAEFEDTQPFSEGLAAVSKDGDSWGYVDKKGKMVIPPKFDYGNPFKGGLARACTDIHKCGYINKTGEFVYIDPD